MSAGLAVLICVFLPIAGSLAIVAARRDPDLREAVSLITAGTVLAAALSLYPAVAAGERPELLLVAFLPGLSLAFVVEPLGMLFAMIASSLWLVTTIYSIGYMRGHGESNQTRFYACFAIAIGSALGIAFAGNLLTMFVFYEVLTLCTYPLVTHAGTDDAHRAGRVYLGTLLGTSIALQLTAIAWVYSVAGTLDFRPGGVLTGAMSPGLAGIVFAMFVFGVGKAALMPFHRWLPAAMVAPTPVSALLHAVAVVKAGVFCVLKVSVYIFGVDLLAASGGADFIAYAAGTTILLASFVAMRKDNLKARLAYSTISQLSYIVLGAALANQLAAVGAGMHIAMHAVGKITLFFCAGAIMVATHKTEVSQMRGLGRRMPITMGAFLLGSLCIIGLPPLGGMWSKWYLAMGAVEAGQGLLLAVLMISSLLNIAYLLPIPIRAFFSAPDAGEDGHHGEEGHEPEARAFEAPLPCVVALATTAAACLLLFVFPEPIFRLLDQL